MPFDPETGAYTTGGDRPWSMPSTSSADVVSAFNTYAAYRRNREAQVLDTMLKLQKTGESGYDVSQTPEGGEALETLGISPETSKDLYLRSPEARFESGLNELPPDQRTEENISQLGLSTGALNLKDYMTQSNRAIGAKARSDQAAVAGQRAFNTSAKDTWAKAIDTNDTIEGARAQFNAQMKFLYPDIEDDRLALAQSSVEGAFGGKQGATVKKLDSETTLNKDKAWALIMKLPAQVNLMNAKATLDGASAGLKQAETEIAQMKAAGTLPASEKDYINAINRVDEITASVNKILPVLPEQKTGIAATLAELKQRSAALKGQLNMAQTAPPPAAAAKAGKDKNKGKTPPKGALGASSQPDETTKYFNGRPVVSRGGWWYYADAK